MSGNTPVPRKKLDPGTQLVATAWERFAAGEEEIEGVRPEVLLSWKRCRDDYGVDPTRDRAPMADAPPLSAEESVVAAELGAAAMTLRDDVRAIDGVLAVADGTGRILATWGSERTLGQGRTQNLDPMFSWTEPTTGTSGVGTALTSRDAVAITRHEHWCTAFHDWSCAAVAVRDPMSDAPVGVIDVSVWNRPLPAATVGALRRAVGDVEERLHERAARAYGHLIDAYRLREEHAAGVAVLDRAGRVVLADASARTALDVAHSHLREVARTVAQRTQRDGDWVGMVELASGATVSVEPVSSSEGVAGVLVRVEGGAADSEHVDLPTESSELLQRRVVGLRGERMILLPATTVRTVLLENGLVWLETDAGRLRTPARGLDQLEERLGAGFLRVNRHTLVNLARVREVAPSFKGGLWLLVDGGDAPIQVSRRRAGALRRALGL